jgi:hypothetical protein
VRLEPGSIAGCPHAGDWNGEAVAGNEIDCRGLNFPGTAPKGPGEEDIPGLREVPPSPGTNCAGNGKPGSPWLLEADEVGRGGEKGSGGYCADACLLGWLVGGD